MSEDYYRRRRPRRAGPTAFARGFGGPQRMVNQIMEQEARSQGLDLDMNFPVNRENMLQEELDRQMEIWEALAMLEHEVHQLSNQRRRNTVTMPPGNARQTYRG